MKVDVIEHGTYIEARVQGLVSLHAWETMLTDLSRDVAGRKGDRLMLDLFGLLGYLGEADRRVVGALFATQLRSMKKVALVIEAQKITGVVRAEAQRLGLDLQLFSDRAEAQSWLLA